MKVLKFGGTSVGCAASIKSVLKCIKPYESESKVVLLSAVSGTTDKLLYIANNSISNPEISKSALEELRSLHLGILNELTGNSNNPTLSIINEYFDRLFLSICAFRDLGELTKRNIDSVICYGELLSTAIFAEYCNSVGISVILLDSRMLIKTDSNFTNSMVDFDSTQKEFLASESLFRNNKLLIAQGFVASDLQNRSTTLGRGGSDYSASVFAFILKSIGFSIDEIQIWTDVSGVLSADPRIINNVKTIAAMDYSEIRTLSYLGAKVLHPDTIKPAISAQIPVRVLNTHKPDDSSTLIFQFNDDNNSGIHSIIRIENCFELSISATPHKSSFDIITKVMNVARNGNCKVIYTSVSEDSAKLYFLGNASMLVDTDFDAVLKFSQITILAITGINIMNYLNRISILSDIKDSILCGVSDNCIYYKFTSEVNDTLLNEIHDSIFLLNKF